MTFMKNIPQIDISSWLTKYQEYTILTQNSK